MRARFRSNPGRETSSSSRTDADKPAALDVNDHITVPDRARTMRDEEARARGDQPVDRLDDSCLGPGVYGTGGLVEDQDRLALYKRAPHPHPLPLPARPTHA